MTFFRLGEFVGYFIEGFQGIALSSGRLTAAANTVPARFVPAVETEQIVIVNQSSTGTNGGLQIYPDGSLICYAVGVNYNFNATYYCGINSQSVFWAYSVL